MLKILLAVLITIASLGDLVGSKVDTKDLDLLTGAQWKGTLTYLNYRSKKKVSIPSHLTVTKSSGDQHTWVFDYEYPDEPKANGKKSMVVSQDGSAVNDEKVTERVKVSEDTVKLVTEKPGEDNDRKALFRYTYLIGSRSFSIKKEVRYENESEWFERNEYSWQR